MNVDHITAGRLRWLADLLDVHPDLACHGAYQYPDGLWLVAGSTGDVQRWADLMGEPVTVQAAGRGYTHTATSGSSLGVRLHVGCTAMSARNAA